MAVPLEYARRSRRRVPLMRIVVVVVVLSLAAAGWHYRKLIQDRYRMYALQRQCMNYTAPADQIAYEMFESHGNELVKRDAAYRQNYYRAMFVHARRCKGGESRLVVAELEGSQPDVKFHVFKAGEWGLLPIPLWHKRVDSELGELMMQPLLVADGGAKGIRVFFGRPDPADESRFTIRASIDGVEVFLICTLQPDDTVRLEIPGSDQARRKLQEPRVPAGAGAGIGGEEFLAGFCGGMS